MTVTPDLVNTLLKAPVADKLPEVTEREWRMRDAQHRAACAKTDMERALWTARYEAAKGAGR